MPSYGARTQRQGNTRSTGRQRRINKRKFVRRIAGAIRKTRVGYRRRYGFGDGAQRSDRNMPFGAGQTITIKLIGRPVVKDTKVDPRQNFAFKGSDLYATIIDLDTNNALARLWVDFEEWRCVEQTTKLWIEYDESSNINGTINTTASPNTVSVQETSRPLVRMYVCYDPDGVASTYDELNMRRAGVTWEFLKPYEVKTMKLRPAFKQAYINKDETTPARATLHTSKLAFGQWFDTSNFTLTNMDETVSSNNHMITFGQESLQESTQAKAYLYQHEYTIEFRGFKGPAIYNQNL